METSAPNEIKQEVKKHILIYGGLLFLTGVNFFLSRMHLLGELTVLGVIFIAVVQGAMVACYFMHLISEKKFIHYVLIMAVFFIFGLFLLPFYEYWGKLFGTVYVH